MKIDSRVYEVMAIVASHKCGKITYMDMRRQCSLDEIKVGNALISALIIKEVLGK